MDPRYSYYPSSGHDALSSQRPTRQDYARSASNLSIPTAANPYPFDQQGTLSGSLPPSYHAGASYTHHHAPQYHNSNALPPPTQGYSRDVTHSGRHDVPSEFSMPPLGPTLHDLPFSSSAPRASSSSSSSNRNSGNWGSAHPASRTPPLQPGYERAGTYPPPRSSPQQHPSLSHSTHLIPTPAQTVARTYNGAYASLSPPCTPGGAIPPPPPMIASIPPASGSSPPQERYYCEKCDKSFGRQHDKKRHIDSTHNQHSHTCRFCHKTFSRNDSLKRHQDNGCDKDPEFHS